MRALSLGGPAAVIALVCMALAGGALAQARIGFVYVGPIGDHGWTYRHNECRLAIEREFGDAVSTSYVENVSEGPDAERVVRQLASTGHDLIFTTSFGFMNPTARVAQRFPKVKFEHATGYKRADNLATYSARFYEGRYISGVIAGTMTKSNKIGYVASFPIPEVVRGINAFFLGARSVNPDISISMVWVNTWYDPGKESDAATTLIDQGADIITSHTDSPAPLQVAQTRGVLGFGQASDMHAFAPDAQLSAIIDNWDPYCVARAGRCWTAAGRRPTPGAGSIPAWLKWRPTPTCPKRSRHLPARPRKRSGRVRCIRSPVRSATSRAPWWFPKARSPTTACCSAWTSTSRGSTARCRTESRRGGARTTRVRRGPRPCAASRR